MMVDPFELLPARIRVFDTTLRDGEQAPGFGMSVAGKVDLARRLEALGVDVVEAGFPMASATDFEAVRAVAAAVRGPQVAALARAIPADVERAWVAIEGAARPRLHVFLATSDLHLSAKLRIGRAECLRRAVEAVRLACARCGDVEFSAEDATRTDPAFLLEVAEAVVEAGAATLNLPDTVGYAVPAEVARMFSAVRARIGTRAVLSAHCHDDLGLAVANTIAAVEAGARQVECTINGIGERAGNAALEEVVMALAVRADHLPYATAIHTEALVPTSQALAAIVGVGVPPNKAIVGANAFAHEAGIHQDGMIKDAGTYEIVTPTRVGASGTRLVLGRHSGKRGVDARCRALGHGLAGDTLDQVYRGVLACADQGRAVSDEDLARLIAAALPPQAGRPPAGPVKAGGAHA